MILQAFSMQGFKSFPDKTTMSFHDGVTAVVGPNGSGKSNIAEAVRWVLGEQNARVLRCEKKMEEIIFHGTAQRGPVGFAEASLMLSNEGGLFPVESADVTITRRLYRSGESEYYINKNLVRLKDVLELFMDTGLGRDGYSIIGQGRISEIISEKSGDRRRVFEEASGISRFRYRKEEAERKLKSAEENLTRINDKIEELRLQVEPLKEQAEAARQYLHLRDELRGLEINVWLDALDRVRAGFGKVRDDLAVAAGQLSEGKERLEALYAQREALSAHWQQKSIEAETAREALSALETRLGECTAAMELLSVERRHNQEDTDRIQEELAKQDDRAGDLHGQIAQRKAQLADVRQNIRDAGAQWDTLLRQAREHADASGELDARADALRTLLTEKQIAEAALREKLSSLQTASEEMAGQRSGFDEDIAAGERAVSEAERLLSQTETELGQAQEQIVSLQNVIDGYALRKDARQKKVEGLRVQTGKLEVTLGSVTARQKMLADMEREWDGFYQAVKITMREAQRGALKGVLGTVSSLIRVKEEYVTAIEIALGSALQNIVVQQEEDGKAAITLLKRQQGGRATFLPLTAVKGKHMDAGNIASQPGFIGIASRLTEYEAPYDGVIASLLGRTVICEDMDSAIAMARRSGYAFRIVTLDGQILSQSGAMTGGSAGKNVGLLSRRNERERLAAEQTKWEKEKARLSGELAEAEREWSAVTFEWETAVGERRTAEDSVLSLSQALQHRQLLRDQAVSHLDECKNEQEALDARLRDNRAQTAQGETELETTRQKARELEQSLLALGESREGFSRQSDALSEQMAQMRAQNSRWEAEAIAHEAALAEYESLQKQFSGDKAQREALLAKHKQTDETLALQIVQKQAEAEGLAGDCHAQKERLETLFQDQQEIEAARNRCDTDIKGQNEENLKLHGECARLEARKLTGEAEEKQFLDRLWENYALSHTDALALRTPIESVAKANRRISELKKAIAALGTPNIGAIDEYSRVSERYEYLSTQHDDAFRAKTDLEDIIADITGQMRQIFSEQFELINLSFGETFGEIFGGGQAYLELSDPSDILHCDVEIKAQPPGKKLRSISLLSGGEKSLVAIALYFALFKVRPAPFCVLDEIDHELDDVNVTRFAAYLTKLGIQFVVITHRRGTMEVADVLYGVTTQEEGVSKVLTLDLRQVEESLQMKLD